HLVGIVGPRLSREEVERLSLAVFLVEEHRAVLDLETTRLDLTPHAHLLQQQHGGRHERLAHVEAWKDFSLEQRDLQPAANEKRRRRRAPGPAAHHDDVVSDLTHSDASSMAVCPTVGIAMGPAVSRS